MAGVRSEVRLDKLLKYYTMAEMVGIGSYRLPSSLEHDDLARGLVKDPVWNVDMVEPGCS